MEDGGPAYPQYKADIANPLDGGKGLSKREAFTMAAMQGILANSKIAESFIESEEIDPGFVPQMIGNMAVAHADATLAALREEG